ncbi:MAG TPA: FAD-dependent monooxygenase [Xanthobacteraceae bacterium]|nr:FAD-dependent monooxygenase [Xanthobacteraceae bacterium]
MSIGGPQNIPVAIVGGGPVGLMLALFLDRYGVRSVIFNSEAEVRPHPKGSSHNSRTMEHHRRLGIAQNIRSFSLPPDRPTDVSYFTRITGWELARLRMPSEAEKQRMVAASGVTDQVPEPILRANQMYVEAFLLAHARTRPNITVRFGWQVDKFDDDDKGVTLEAEAVAGSAKGARETWRAQYLVGCDGGRSFVRRSLALRYHGFAKLDAPHYGGRMIATHMRAPTLYRDHLKHRHGWQYWTVNADARMTLISLRGDEEFLVFSKARDDADAPPSDEAMARHITRAIGAELPLSMLDHRLWTAGVALVAEHFIAGRVILAGDAAHLFTPTGGFGMNTGMDDTSNLSWKLAAILQGWGGKNLLQTYETERRPVAERNTMAARELNVHLASVTVPDTVEQDSVEGEAARRHVSAQFATFGEEFASLGVQLGARYDGSPIITEDGAPPADNYVRYTPSSMPGGRMPHFWLDRGRGYGSSIFDRLGFGFSLLRLGGTAADTRGIAQAAHACHVPFEVLDVPDTAVRDLYERDLVLLRPDQYVAWRGNALPPEPNRLLAKLVGAL